MLSESDIEKYLVDQISAVSATGVPVTIKAGNSKSFYGENIDALEIDVSEHRGVIDYDPAELVITLRGGCKLSEVEALLAQKKQMFAFEAPHFDVNATIGGMIATGLCGPRRAYAGNIRDYVLGVKILDGRGQVLSFGGRVIKNVAGFDISRTMVGAMGSLGIILEASIRVIPCFQKEQTLMIEHETASQHIKWINQLAGLPYPISAALWHAGKSYIRLSGSEQGVADSGNKIDASPVDFDWHSVKEQTYDFFDHNQPLTRVAVKQTTSDLFADRGQLIEWGGAQRWLNEEIDINQLRTDCVDYGADICAFRHHTGPVDVFQPLPPAILALQRRLKSSFDPAGIFNPGKLYAQL